MLSSAVPPTPAPKRPKMTAEVQAYARWLAIQGGKARAAQLTTEDRSKMGKLGAAARWKGVTKAERKKVARRAARARWGARKLG